MLIKALCDYYDIMAAENKILPDGYSNLPVHFCICLTLDGKIEDIVSWQTEEAEIDKKGVPRKRLRPKNELLPLREQATTIRANIVEHRPLYIFGLNFEKDQLTAEDPKDKAKKSHEDFVTRNIAFLEGLDSPVINAYRAFILNWVPADEEENPKLVGLGKQYANSSFVFSVSGRTDQLLHNDPLLKEKWNRERAEQKSAEVAGFRAQCAITGQYHEPIARIHHKIKGISGGLSTGTVMVGYNFPAVCSYMNEQSYNSNISETAMEKYTTALNMLLSDKRHKETMDDMTVLYWANGGENAQKCTDLMSYLCFGNSDEMDQEKTDEMLDSIMKSAKEGSVLEERFNVSDTLFENVDFYIVGIKPNTSRAALKFIYRKRFGEMLQNIATHQRDLQMGTEVRALPMWRIKKELVTPNSTNAKIHQSLIEELFKSIICGADYPEYLLSTMIRRVKTDRSINDIRAGVIKACINRRARIQNKKEELTVSLDKANTNQAYLCGRLFAVLEKLQEDVSGGSLNSAIKDAFFASASVKPMLVFPKLLRLAQYHLKKLGESKRIYYKKLMQEIIDCIDDEFPGILMLAEQGKFMVGYYQQYNEFYKPKQNNEKVEEL
ncbi:MAG: type I-C CRISPR-associated protein Cas8c/Csd1 [Lachnospiraceae bacterium]|nr:type I-C CRISPR-associated protein Cas8c/Csd1 [Lachnospiraceae bacterium]